MWWLSFFLFAVAAYLLQYFWDSIRAVYMLWNVTGPLAYPGIGSGYLFINKTQAGVYFCVCVCARLM